MNGLRIAAVGGGHGLSETLRALVRLSLRPTAIVTVADDGGSSGRLRDELGVIPPGDMRMALLTIAGRRDLADVMGLRFTTGALEGHPLGNLLLVVLAEHADGDFVAALDRAGDLLACQGRVLPCTTESVVLRARVDGRQVDGQVTVATTTGHTEQLWLDPVDPPACPAAVEELEAAEVIVFGPGSLYTSVIPNLLVPGIAGAVRRSRARLVYVANLTTQPGETEGMDTTDHVDALLAHLGEGAELDGLVLHAGPAGGGPGAPLGALPAHPRVRKVVRADLARRGADGALSVGHDPALLADALRELLPAGISAEPAAARGGRATRQDEHR